MGLWDRLFGRPSPDQFAQMMVKALREAGAPEPIEYEADEYQLAIGTTAKLYLGHAYDEYRSAPRQTRLDVIRRYVQLAVTVREDPIPHDYEEARPHLRPWVRDRFYYEALRLRSQIQSGTMPGLPHRVMAEHLVVMLAYDLPEQVYMVTDDHLSAWGVSFDEAVAAARGNLLEGGVAAISLKSGVHMLPPGDSYNASRLFHHDLVRRFEVQGQHVAMIPNRESLIVTGSDNEEGLTLMASLAEDALKEARPMTGVAVRLEGDQWLPFMPPAGHPAFAQFRKLFVGSAQRDYEEQKRLLEALHEKTGEDIFVAAYMVGETTDGGDVLTYCVWSEGVDSLLPRTDRVLFARGDPDSPDILGMAQWERVFSIAGDLMTPLDIYPDRFRVQQFPTPDQREAMELET